MMLKIQRNFQGPQNALMSLAKGSTYGNTDWWALTVYRKIKKLVYLPETREPTGLEAVLKSKNGATIQLGEGLLELRVV